MNPKPTMINRTAVPPATSPESPCSPDEIKSFLVHPAFRVALSAPHLLEYFTFQNVFSNGTLFAGVEMLPAGHWRLA